MLEIINITNSEPCNALFDILGQFHASKGNQPFKRILQIVLAQGCRTILVEPDFKDEQWKGEHSWIYRKTFKNYPDTTKRLHFFTSKLKTEDLISLESRQEEYLGFCVLRPLESAKTSTAIIRPVIDTNEPKKSFLLCQKEFVVPIEVNAKNTQMLRIKGTPFTQQDGEVGCCSHAAINIVDNLLIDSEYGPTRETKKNAPYLTIDIAKLVDSIPYSGKQKPTEGLTPAVIAEVLKRLGYTPLFYQYGKDQPPPPFPPEKIIYHYLESKIPIILGIPTYRGKHALTVVGHSFEPDLWWAVAETPYYNRKPSGINYHCSTTWVQNFIIQDDNFGPYLTIPKELLWYFEKDKLIIVVALPPGIFIQAEDAETIAYSLIASAAEIRKSQRSSLIVNDPSLFKWFDIFYDHSKKNDMVLRTWLIGSEIFKKSYVSPSTQSCYNSIELPEKIWLTEISIPELFSQKRLRLGEVLIDPTGSKNRAPFLTIHLPGFMATRNVETELLSFFDIPNDQPFEHIMR